MENYGYLTKGKVIRVSPALNTYEVLADSGFRFKQALALRNTAAGLYGAHSAESFPPGTRVLMYVPDEGTSGTSVAIVIGTVNDSPIADSKAYDLSSVTHNILSMFIGRFDNNPERSVAGTIMEHSYNYGAAFDSVPTEFNKNTYMGGGICLSDFIAYMKVNEQAAFELFYEHSMARLTATRFQQKVACTSATSFVERNLFHNSVIQSSATTRELLGAVEKDTFNIDKPFLFAQKTPRKISHQRIDGDLAQGSLDTLILPSYKGDVGLNQVQRGYDGSYTIRALGDIVLERTSLIQVPTSLGAPDTPITTKDVQDIPTEQFKLDVADTGFFGSQAVDYTREHNIDKNSLTKLKARGKLWSIPKDKSDIVKALDAAELDVSSDLSMELLENEAYYDEPPTRSTLKSGVDDKGERVEAGEVFDVSSLIKQSADGSIIISGGWGEEIRMYRGNIYLTCPGDVIATPGRDMVNIAGRNNINKAIKGTLESEGESVSIVAGGNMQLLGGAGGVGTTIIENKAKQAFDFNKYEDNMLQNKPSGGGVLIKGHNVSAVSDNIYLQGADYNKSTINIKAKVITSVADQVNNHIQDTGAFNVITKKAGISITSELASILGSTVVLNAKDILCVASKASAQRISADTDKPTSVSIGGSGKANLLVQGFAQVNDLSAMGSISSRSGGELSKNGNTTVANFNKSINSASITDSLIFSLLHITPMLDTYVKKKQLETLGVVFPENIYTELSLPVSKWQTAMHNADQWGTALEIAKSFSTGAEKVMTYPGKDNFNAAGSLQKLEKTGIVSNTSLKEYLINH